MKNKWQPTASLQALKERARLLKEIRLFFEFRDILEVETPVLSKSGTTELGIQSFSTILGLSTDIKKTNLWLQTSPEFHMKRLLAAYGVPIYQISKVFRNEELSEKHNPEFTMLEWYRPGWELMQLTTEIMELIDIILGEDKWYKFTYEAIFEEFVKLNPFTSHLSEMQSKVKYMGGQNSEKFSRDDCLDFFMALLVEPFMEDLGRVIITDFPASQASLSQVITNKAGQTIAERCEFFINGVEIANAYQELNNPARQSARFAKDIMLRKERGLEQVPPPSELISAMSSDTGLPSASGVALGLDRLLMLKGNYENISEVLSFDIVSS